MTSLDNSPNITQVWIDCLSEISNQISPDALEKWFNKLQLEVINQGSVTVLAGDEFTHMWISDKYLDLIEQAFSKVLGRPVEVVLGVSQRKTEPEEEQANKVVQLNFWPSTERAAPNPILRSALFGIVQRGRRQLLNDESLASWRGVELIYSGERLNQNDLDVWMHALHLHRREELGKPVFFTWRGFLKDMGKAGSGQNIQWLKKTINRLTKSHILIQTERYTYAGGLLHDWGEDEYTGRFFLTANPTLSRFFVYEDYTRMNWEERLALTDGTEYARWLHAFISTHDAPADKPSRVRLEKLRELCGSTISRMRDFRARVESAMIQLEEAGHVTHWAIDKDRNILIYATR